MKWINESSVELNTLTKTIHCTGRLVSSWRDVQPDGRILGSLSAPRPSPAAPCPPILARAPLPTLSSRFEARALRQWRPTSTRAAARRCWVLRLRREPVHSALPRRVLRRRQHSAPPCCAGPYLASVDADRKDHGVLVTPTPPYNHPTTSWLVFESSTLVAWLGFRTDSYTPPEQPPWHDHDLSSEDQGREATQLDPIIVELLTLPIRLYIASYDPTGRVLSILAVLTSPIPATSPYTPSSSTRHCCLPTSTCATPPPGAAPAAVPPSFSCASAPSNSAARPPTSSSSLPLAAFIVHTL